MSGNLEIVFQRTICNGSQKVYRHFSPTTNCDMKFSIFIPDKVSYDEKFRTLFFLPGAECNEQHFLNRTEFHEQASQARFILVCPDTSPRVDLPGDSDDKLVGKGAGWYIDATAEPFKKHYQMYSYVAKELYDLVLKNFPVLPKFGICGHSMGGCGAICIGLRNPDKFPSISLFAPNCNPISWGHKIVFTTLLGDDKEDWKVYDGSQVALQYDGPRREILLDQGLADEFYRTTKTLNPERLVEAAESCNNERGKKLLQVNLRMHPGLDHGFNFVKKFWKEHFAHHARNLFLESQGI